jgi:hypothetical protein
MSLCALAALDRKFLNPNLMGTGGLQTYIGMVLAVCPSRHLSRVRLQLPPGWSRFI